MEAFTEEVGENLNDLLEKTYDAIGGYNRAAVHADSQNLANYFTKNSLQRKEFAEKLAEQIRRTGEPANTDHSLSADVHRSWMDIKAFLSNNNDEAMLAEIIRGEKVAVLEFKEVLKEKLPQKVRGILNSQLNVIETSLKIVKSLEDIID